jgi:rubrerythrin
MTDDIKILLGQAIRSEIDAREFYTGLAGRVKNLLLKERLVFLASEEEKHESFLMGFYRDKFREEPVVPETSPVPSPRYVPGEKTPISDLLAEAMEAEQAAEEFYRDMSNLLLDEEKALLGYLALMERGHFHILEAEREMALHFEDYDAVNPMFHMGV